MYNVVKSDWIPKFSSLSNFNDDCDWREITFTDEWEHLKHLALDGLYVDNKGG